MSPAPPFRWLVLGPFEVWDGERRVDVGVGKQGALLALLLVRRGASVPLDVLIEELWEAAPPATAHKSVHVYVSRLRKALGEGVIETRASGYALRADDRHVDAAAFEAAVDAARGLPPAERARALRRALDTWRGPAFADLRDAGFAVREADRLEDLRLGALEDRLDAELGLGHHRRVVPELRALVAAHPLREGFRRLLMLALYRSGRQAEALESYRAARRVLVDELGLEPAPALRRLERQILNHDPALRAAEDPLPRLPRRRRLAAVAALTAGLAVLAGILAATRGGEAVVAVADGVTMIDPASEQVVARVRVAAEPVAVAAGDGAVWVAGGRDLVLQRLDPGRRAVVRTIGTGAIASALALGPDAVWVADSANGTLARVDPATSAVVSVTRVRRGDDGDVFARATPSALAATAGAVWTNRGLSRLQRVPTADLARPVRTDLGPSGSSDALALGWGALWVASGADGRLLRIDPGSLRLRSSLSLPGLARPVGMAAGAGAVWVADRGGRVLRVDPHTFHVAATATGGELVAVAVGAGGVWALSGASVLRLDPATGHVTARIAVGGHPTALAAGEGAVWVTTSTRPRSAMAGPPLRTLPRSACGGVYYEGAGAPRLLIASDEPLYWRDTPALHAAILAQVAAIKTVLRRHDFRAGRFTVGYQSCDDSTPRAGYWTARQCLANARAYAATPALVGLIGPEHSQCARLQLPILNAAPDGPLAAIAPANSYLGLTRAGPGTGPDEPERYRPTGRPGYVRIAGPDDAQGAALALLARRLGARSAYVLDDASTNGMAVGRSATAAAPAAGLAIAGAGRWDAQGRRVRSLARRVRASGAQAVVLAGCWCLHGGELLAALRAELDPRVAILASDAWTTIEQMAREIGPDAEGMYVIYQGAPAPPYTPVEANENGNEAGAAAAATEILLDAIAASDGTRASVAANVTDAAPHRTVLGTIRFDANGDNTAPVFTAYRVEHGRGAVAGSLRPTVALLHAVRSARPR